MLQASVIAVLGNCIQTYSTHNVATDLVTRADVASTISIDENSQYGVTGAGALIVG